MNEEQLRRREKNNAFIDNSGISYFKDLPLIESSDQVYVKSIETICKKAIASLFVIQLAIDIMNEKDYNEARGIVLQFLEKYNIDLVIDLTVKEKRLVNGNYTMQDAIDVSWTYECYWSLVWALGLVDSIVVPDDICDCEKAINLVMDCPTYEDFLLKTKFRTTNDILDMVDLYYRYHWVCVEKRINPETTNIGFLNPDVVIERRKGLEWIISQELDWDEISLDT